MKFGDKLIELRKKNGYSQEELAERLGVSRQSVSKWESNNTYPETDKIIQISNLFDCSMDDLINDKITDIESTKRKKRSNVKKIWNSFLEFITSTIDMFTQMKFLDGFKCLIVMMLLIIGLHILGKIISNNTANIFANIFTFIDGNFVHWIKEILKNIFYLIWFIISVIIITHVFKIKYLNNYTKTVVKDKTQKNEELIKKNENDKPFEFLEVLAKIVIIFIKIFAGFMILGIALSTIGLIIGLILVITHITTNILFLWITLLIIAVTTISMQIIILLFKFIFNIKININLNIIVFLSCVALIGISIGLITLHIKNIEFVNDKTVFNLTDETIDIEYRDNLVIESNGVGLTNQYRYIIDNSIEENKIKVSRKMDTRYFDLYTLNSEMDNLNVITINETSNTNLKSYYELFIRNLEKNKIVTFNDYGNDPLVIRANETTINKLIYNLKLLYLIEENRKENAINITIKDYKVYFPNGLNGEYAAINDSIKYNVTNYACKKEIEITGYGEKFIYTCDYTEIEG